ncbi:hypothetical protein V1514DRAFT_326814 [Lipomyces japonicus]|uniref:uncharacterized protein n=1 Tax=Lipomyces japonicus TaxID=56871 RepID=UPI0034CDF3B4
MSSFNLFGGGVGVGGSDGFGQSSWPQDHQLTGLQHTQQFQDGPVVDLPMVLDDVDDRLDQLHDYDDDDDENSGYDSYDEFGLGDGGIMLDDNAELWRHESYDATRRHEPAGFQSQPLKRHHDPVTPVRSSFMSPTPATPVHAFASLKSASPIAAAGGMNHGMTAWQYYESTGRCPYMDQLQPSPFVTVQQRRKRSADFSPPNSSPSSFAFAVSSPVKRMKRMVSRKIDSSPIRDMRW